MEHFLSILSTQFDDLNGCLVNCSSKGICQLNSNTPMYECECDSHFSGSSCQHDLRPCSSGPCLNNGTCLNINNDTSFQCECQNTFYGQFFEKQISICQNKTCNQKGFCFNNRNTPGLLWV